MKRIIPLLLLAFAVAACQDDGPTVPTDGPQFGKGDGKPNCDINPSHPSCKDGDGNGTVVESADGDYWMTVYRLPDNTKQNRWFRFDAKKYEDGTVVGEWRVERFSMSGRRVSKSLGEISCFTINGNQAWLGGTQKGGPQPNEVVWRVIDGDLVDPVIDDQSSLACNHLPGLGCGYQPLDGWTAEEYCAATLDHPPLIPIEGGTIEITQ